MWKKHPDCNFHEHDDSLVLDTGDNVVCTFCVGMLSDSDQAKFWSLMPGPAEDPGQPKLRVNLERLAGQYRTIKEVECEWDHCDDPNHESHKGWRHATSIEEIREALAKGHQVFDYEGDRILQVDDLDEGEYDDGEEDRMGAWFWTSGNRVAKWYPKPSQVLLPAWEEVTDEELEATIQSIAAASDARLF